MPPCYDKLIFGGGTKLTVEPKTKPNKEPTLSIFYPPVNMLVIDTDSSDTAAVCLLSEFYPKEIEVSMTRGSETKVTNTSVVTNDGYYHSSNYIPFSSKAGPENITCTAKHSGNIHSESITFKKSEPTTSAPVNCHTGISSNQTQTDPAEENSMSLTVMGLRILFFKSVAFNVLMTARAWVI